MAVPPSGFGQIVRNLHESGLHKSDAGWTRIVVEKPFGTDMESAKRLNHEILRVFHEEQVYRIDHYLGKETVQNILVFRFANAILEPVWNEKYVDHVQITIAESLGVEDRGAFYDHTGALGHHNAGASGVAVGVRADRARRETVEEALKHGCHG